MFSYENINYLVGYNPHRKYENSTSSFLIPFFTGGFSRCIASAALLPLNVVKIRL